MYYYYFFNFPYNYKKRVVACFQTRPENLTYFEGWLELLTRGTWTEGPEVCPWPRSSDPPPPCPCPCPCCTPEHSRRWSTGRPRAFGSRRWGPSRCRGRGTPSPSSRPTSLRGCKKMCRSLPQQLGSDTRSPWW